MTGDSETVSTAGAVRTGIELGRLPWVRSFHAAYELNFASVASFFAGHPGDPSAWPPVMAAVARGARDRALTAEIVGQELVARGAPDAARANARRLADPATFAVLTGQQAGLFGGPLYTVLKAITTIQLARQVEARHGVPTVPVFWVAAEDHDWDEVRSAVVLDSEMAPRRLTVPDVAGAGARPVGALLLDEGIGPVIDALAASLPRTAWTDDLLADLRRHYRPGSDLGTALAGWLDQLFGRHGLVVFNGASPSAKPLVADLFAAELDAPERTASEVRRQAAALEALGHGAQVVPTEHATALFYLDATGRHPIRYADGTFLVGDAPREPADLRAEALAHPDRFSPNVMLRPLVQDQLFPTICYVAGPGELAYQAQFGGVYDAFGVARPLFASRASATFVDAAAARFLERQDVPFEDLAIRDDSVLNRLVERELTSGYGAAADEAETAIRDRMAALKAAAETVDPTLGGAADTTLSRMQQAMDGLRQKIVRAAKRRDDTLRRQFTRTRTLCFPDGHPQERTLSVAALINQYGPGLLDQLLDELPVDASRHYLVVP